MTYDSRFLVVGESVVDLVAPADTAVTAAPGGSPANVAVALGRLGDDVEFVTELGGDEGGALIRRHLENSGVSVTAQTVARTPSARTVIDPSGVPAYDFDLGWTLRPPLGVPTGAVVHIGSLGALLQPGATTVTDLLDRLAPGAVVSYDPNCRPALMGEVAAARSAVERLVARAHVVKVSEEDLDWLYPGEPVGAVAERWRSSGPAVVVVTRGGDGSLGVTTRGAVERPAAEVVVGDTIGAGDAFMAGLLHRFAEQGLLAQSRLGTVGPDELADALGFAAEVAAVTCSRVGADPPWRAELPDRVRG